ncbi:hypothetical protein QFZ57_000327 [Arthrobacter sp. B1I2]|nr:hypothetical protein [Arthrobacter sp. B1I2]
MSDDGPAVRKAARLDCRAAFGLSGTCCPVVRRACQAGWNAPMLSKVMFALLQALVGCGMNSESVSSGG